MLTRTFSMSMLCVLFFGKQMSLGDNGAAAPELQAQLEEAVVARNVAEQRCVELKASLVQTRKDLEALRGRYAELLVSSRKREAETEQLRLEVAKLLFEPDGKPDNSLTAQAVRTLQETYEANAALYRDIRAFAEYLPGVLDALEPSAAIRREVGERLQQLVQLLNRAERLPSSVAGRGGSEDRSHREGRVLAVSDEYQVVILDVGVAAGVRPGMLWSVYNTDDQRTHVLRVVERRSSMCAAMPIKGNLDSIAPGMLVKAGGGQITSK